MAGPEAIRVSELLAYCQLVGIDSFDARSKYLRLIQRMDAVYIKHWHETNNTK